MLFVISVLWLLPAFLPTVFELLWHGNVEWSGYVMGAVLLTYVVLILPFWFRAPNPVIFVPCDFAAALLFCLPLLLAPPSTLWVLLPYHLISLLISTICDGKYPQTDRWVNYCKPLTVTEQFIFQHILYLLLGILIVRLWQKKHK